ncbi:hypothetical protein Cpir12675_006115 [Ceratocystis pirilliformis]|uniref:Uncharacterized protein n=1 Tax=Ceratocystis pirilliformis TaxID=259994 RepID=A0ABR3YL54_9PEZI
MERIQELEGLSQVPSPCDKVDFIGGMGTGGFHPGVYHKFNVENGLRDTTILDCHSMSKISAHTINYLNENAQAVKRLVAAFTMRARHNEKDKECLADLHVTDPRTDKKEIESKKGGLLTGCRQWITEHKDFQ